MTPLYDTQEFYKKMLELQERLRKSEEERMTLEERFNLLSQDSRHRRETCINNLRMRYIDFLEEQRLRDERNHKILGALDKIDGSLARMTARTDRLGILRKQYEAYLLRVYANRSAGGGTGDSGVGSHNEDRSPKIDVSRILKNSPSTQRTVTQNTDNPPSFIPQTNYPHSYIGPSNISQFNVPRYAPGQETPQVHVMQAHGQGDGSTIVQPQRTPQLFYESQNLNLPNTSLSKRQLVPNVSQELVSPNRSYPQQFLRSNNQLISKHAQVQHHQLYDNSNQYSENPRSLYAGDSSIMRSRNLPDSQEIISSDLQSLSGLQTESESTRDVANYSANLIDEAFGPYRYSTPLPGYLDYSTRYSRDPSVHDPNVALRYGFTRSDLEKVADRTEPILPKDYLHNPETVKSGMHTSKLSSPLEDKRRVTDAKPSKDLNDVELDQYIHRIRSLHRDNDQCLEALDIEQNTSGDLLNATLSDDGSEQLTLHSDNKIKPSETKILSDDIKSVFALADDFVAEPGNLDDDSQLHSNSSNDRKIPSKSVFNPQICNANAVAEGMLAESSPTVLKADTTPDKLSISVTRNDILSGTACVGINQIQDTSAIANSKFKPKITPLIADIDSSRLNITDVATVSQNSFVDPKELLPNECGGNQVPTFSTQEYLKMSVKKSNPDKEVSSQQRTSIEVPNNCQQSVTKDHAVIPKETELREDIEGDKVTLVEREQMPEQVIDVVRELQPPTLQHYEKNVVEIRAGNEDKKDVTIRKVVPDGIGGPKVQENEDSALQRNQKAVNVAETLPQDSITNKIYAESDVTVQKDLEAKQIEEQTFNCSQGEVNKDVQHQDYAEPKYELNSGHEYPTYEHQPGQNLAQDVDGNRDADHRFGQNPEQLYDPVTNEQLSYDTKQTNDESNPLDQPHVTASDKPYESNQIYDANQQYETDPSQRYAQESNPEFPYPNQHAEDDLSTQYAGDRNELYAAASNEQYKANPNEQYTADPDEQYAAGSHDQYISDPNAYTADSNEQYATDRNEQYATDPTEQYPADSNEHYATDPNEEYSANPNQQYDYYQNQAYQNDPNATYENAGNEQQYDYVADQGYQHDPNQQFEHDPNQQYAHDPNQQYEHDPNQQYGHDPNQQYEHDSNQQFEFDPHESSVQDLNHEYKEHEYGQNQGSESVGNEEPEQGGNQQFANDSQQNYASRNPELRASNQDYPIPTAEEQNQIQVTTGDSYIQEFPDPDAIEAKEYSADGKKKNKDVIRALLESDTESTIERNPSNNTESDFDFN